MNIDNFTVKIDTTEAVAATEALTEAAKRVEIAMKSLAVTLDEGIGGA